MKKLLLPLILILGIGGLSGQTRIDHPIDLVDAVVEANEFLIFHTDGVGGSNTKTTVGQYDPAGATPFDRIVEASTVTNPNSMRVQWGKFVNAIAIDYNGDSYDEIVYVVEGTGGVKGLAIPTIDKGNLQGTIDPNDVVQPLPTPSGSENETVKMAKGDFEGDDSEELVILTRSDATGGNELHLQLHKVLGPSPTQNTSLLKELSGIGYTALTFGMEVFDVAVGDFDMDGKNDIAVVAVERINSVRQCYVQYFEVVAPDMVNTFSWDILPKGKLNLSTTGSSGGMENVSIVAAESDTGLYQVAVSLAYRDDNDPNTIHRKVFTVTTDQTPGVYDLNTPVMRATPYTNSNMTGNLPAMSMAAGDLVNNGTEEVVVAWDGEIRVFSVTPGSITLQTTGGAGTVQDEFYKLTKGNSYVSIGDVDWDKSKDILVVTADDDGNSGNPEHSMRVTIFGLSQNLQSLTVKGQREIQHQPWAGAGSDYRFAATIGEFKGGRAMLKEPVRSLKKHFTPLIVNNSPPHHFDVVNGVEADILEAYPNWPSSPQTGTISSQYQAVSSTSHTLETTLKSDWGVSSTLSAGLSKLGNGIKSSITAKYGEEFVNTQTNTNTITISTLSTALSDDQVYGIVQDYEVYEYPVDSSGYTIGYVLALIREGVPIVQWMDSKSSDAINYVSDHEPGNLLSYPSTANFNDYVGVYEMIIKGTGRNIGSGGSLDFTMAFSDFASNSASVTKTFGLEVSSGVGVAAKIFSAGLDVTGSYSRTEITTHVSEAFSEISYKSDLSRALNPQFSDAFYTVTPQVYWAYNGALTLGYSVDPSIPTSGLNNFWTDNYNSQPDLTMILPWRMDEEKGFNLGSTPDKKRLSKSIRVSKTSFITGDTVIITAFIQNYSFVDYNGDVEFQFYAGNPDQGGTLLEDINGQTTYTVTAPFLARERTPVEFAWKVPVGITPGPKIYVVIDPNDKIAEVHEDNNVGFTILGGGGTTDLDEELDAAIATPSLNLNVYPNPSQDWAQVEMVLPTSGHLQVELVDMQGRVVKEAYNDRLHKGNFILPVNLSDVPAGYYLVNVRHNQLQQTMKLVKM